jgi:stalled ribosome rescue protein Dom34
MNAKKLGIWMDHHHAHLTEFTTGEMKSEVIESTFTHKVKEESMTHGENHMHIKEQHLQLEYYKKLGEEIRHYQEVVLFGPTSAKTELFNFLRSNPRFDKIKIELSQKDKMTEHQKHAFVREHFAKQ